MKDKRLKWNRDLREEDLDFCKFEEGTTAHLTPKMIFDDVVAIYGFESSYQWVVDNNNCEAALLVLAGQQPSQLKLLANPDAREALAVAAVARAATGCHVHAAREALPVAAVARAATDCHVHAAREALPVAAVARAAKDCHVHAAFFDTFYSADNTAKDAERLEHLTANQSLTVSEFYGHLDHSAIAKLPHTILYLGLGIGSAADAAAVSGLRPWEELEWISVSVSSRVTTDDLKPLPSVAHKELYFPFLSDVGVDSVMLSIEALVPDLREK